MKQVVDGLLYDTDASTLIGSAHKPFSDYYFYKTQKGRYFCVSISIIGALCGDCDFFTTPNHVKELMLEHIPEIASLIYSDI